MISAELGGLAAADPGGLLHNVPNAAMLLVSLGREGLQPLLAATDPTGGGLQFVRDGGILGILILIVVGAHRGWWYTRSYVDELRRDRDEWKQIALSGTRIAERVAEGSGTVLEQALRRGRS